ncbi:MAG: hypothetical protein AB7S77_13600, partial [Desulfatirhabdiaceae bacterium]
GNYFGTQTERDGGYSQPCWKPEPVTIDIFSATKNTNLKRKILRLSVIFYRSERNNQPVRHWLKGLVREDRKIIGKSMKKVQYGWPVGMPLVR